MKSNPTELQFNALQSLFACFNKELFNNELPNIILNLSRAGSANVGGFFAADRWLESGKADKKGTAIHEISLNPESLRKDPRVVVSILVHEMAHLWQQVFGTPSRSGYHNKEWGQKMEEIGLMPSNTGHEGGKKTGQQMSHYEIEQGKFAIAYDRMDKTLLLPFEHIILPKKEKAKKNKVKYTCPSCGSNVWGKEDLRILCNDCELVEFEQQD